MAEDHAQVLKEGTVAIEFSSLPSHFWRSLWPGCVVRSYQWYLLFFTAYLAVLGPSYSKKRAPMRWRECDGESGPSARQALVTQNLDAKRKRSWNPDIGLTMLKGMAVPTSY